MAGLGAKLFTAFSKLTAAQVNGYLMDQSIMRFATSTARDAAFGGAGEPTLAEGMTCYLDDTNSVQSYNGSAWVTLTSSINPPALELVSGITCSTGGTAANGVVTVGSAVSSVVIGNAFSSTYDNYKIVYTGGTGSGTMSMSLGSSTASYYNTLLYGNTFGTPTASGIGSNNATNWSFVGYVDANICSFCMELQSPNLTKYTTYSSAAYTSTTNAGTSSGVHQVATAYTSFTLIPTSTFTGGTVRVYGYRNQL
jgi:hypothetical protein